MLGAVRQRPLAELVALAGQLVDALDEREDERLHLCFVRIAERLEQDASGRGGGSQLLPLIAGEYLELDARLGLGAVDAP